MMAPRCDSVLASDRKCESRASPMRLPRVLRMSRRMQENIAQAHLSWRVVLLRFGLPPATRVAKIVSRLRHVDFANRVRAE